MVAWIDDGGNDEADVIGELGQPGAVAESDQLDRLTPGAATRTRPGLWQASTGSLDVDTQSENVMLISVDKNLDSVQRQQLGVDWIKGHRHTILRTDAENSKSVDVKCRPYSRRIHCTLLLATGSKDFVAA